MDLLFICYKIFSILYEERCREEWYRKGVLSISAVFFYRQPNGFSGHQLNSSRRLTTSTVSHSTSSSFIADKHIMDITGFGGWLMRISSCNPDMRATESYIQWWSPNSDDTDYVPTLAPPSNSCCCCCCCCEYQLIKRKMEDYVGKKANPRHHRLNGRKNKYTGTRDGSTSTRM